MPNLELGLKPFTQNTFSSTDNDPTRGIGRGRRAGAAPAAAAARAACGGRRDAAACQIRGRSRRCAQAGVSTKAADVAPGRACKRAGRALIEAGRGRRRKRRTVPQAVASLSGRRLHVAARVRACKPRRERGSQSRAWRTCAYPERSERRGLEPAAGDSAAGSAAAPEKPARRARHRQSSDPNTDCVRNTGQKRRRPHGTE